MKTHRRQAIGTTALRIVSSVLYHGSRTQCLCCERGFALDIAAIAMCIGTETFGYICLQCVDADARERLSRVIRSRSGDATKASGRNQQERRHE